MSEPWKCPAISAAYAESEGSSQKLSKAVKAAKVKPSTISKGNNRGTEVLAGRGLVELIPAEWVDMV